MASTFTSDTLPADHKAAIRQMKHALRAQLGDVQQIFNQLSDDIATRVAEINALKAQGDAVWPVLSYADIKAGHVTAEQREQIKRRGCAVIVSGLAEGLDSVCHRAALEGAGPTIGVQGVPIDRTYPASNRWLREEIEAGGCVVGEYPPGDNLAGRNGFLQRNRLIAGLARALVVVQARERSGTMSTVAHAERYGRKIFALPGDIGRENAAGTNRLIQSGRARMALSAEEILEELSLRAAPVPDRQEPPLTETQRKVLACAGSEPKSLEELAAACGMQAAALAAVLMGLELAGRIKALPGQRYILL